MKMLSYPCTALAAALAVLALAACDRESSKRAQESANQALDKTQQKLAAAGDRLKPKLDQAGAEIKPSLERAGEQISAAAEKTGEAIADAAQRATAGMKDSVSASTDSVTANTRGFSATTTTNGASATLSTGEKTSITGISPQTRATLNDTAITASIKADYLKDPDLSVLRIDVDTNGGVVTLNGLAESANARKRAEQIAGGVKGVKEVRNYLTVKPG